MSILGLFDYFKLNNIKIKENRNLFRKNSRFSTFIFNDKENNKEYNIQ